MKRNSVPMNGNHLAAIRSSIALAVMLSCISRKSASTAVCTLFGRCCMRRAM